MESGHAAVIKRSKNWFSRSVMAISYIIAKEKFLLFFMIVVCFTTVLKILNFGYRPELFLQPAKEQDMFLYLYTAICIERKGSESFVSEQKLIFLTH
jgi:hypothetical protein